VRRRPACGPKPFGGRRPGAVRGSDPVTIPHLRAPRRRGVLHRARDTVPRRPSTSLLTSGDFRHNHGSSWLAAGRLPETYRLAEPGAVPCVGLVTPPGAATVSPAGTKPEQAGPGPKRAAARAPRGVAFPIARECETSLKASHNVPIARHVTVRSQAPCASRRSAPSFRGKENDAKPARAKVDRPAGTAKPCCLTSESVSSLDGAPRSGAQSGNSARDGRSSRISLTLMRATFSIRRPPLTGCAASAFSRRGSGHRDG